MTRRRQHQLDELEGLTREDAERRAARLPIGPGMSLELLLAIAIREGRLPERVE